MNLMAINLSLRRKIEKEVSEADKSHICSAAFIVPRRYLVDLLARNWPSYGQRPVAVDDIACPCAAEKRDAEISIGRRKAMDLRYRRLLDLAIGSVKRQTIFKLLAEEMQKMKSKQHQKISNQSVY
jgi:hypothetical protein